MYNCIEFRSIHHEIGLLRSENQDQNIEISQLKDMMIEWHQRDGNFLQELDQRMKKHQQRRVKRPFRLVPKDERIYADKTRKMFPATQRLYYGPPTNCSELSELGHTLNGFYQVQSLKPETQLETVYCAFKQPPGAFNESKVEKRVVAKLKVKNDIEKPRKRVRVGTVHWNSKLKEKDDDDSSYQEKTSTYMPISSTSSVEKCITCLSNNNVKVDNRIHFYSKVTLGNKIALRDLDVIKFYHSLLNLGNAFDAASGVFTAPKSGVYQFFLQGAFSLTKQVDNIFFYITVLRNDNPIDYVIFTQSDIYSPRSVVVTSKLVRGDRIQLKYFKSEKNKKIEGIVSLNWFMFSGSLLEEE